MLESVDNKALQGDAPQDFIFVELDRADCIKALNLREKNERVEVIIRKNELLQLRELLQLVEVRVVDDEVEAHIVEVHLFHQVVELGALEDFQRVAIDVQHPVGFDLGVPALHQRFLGGVEILLAVLLLIQPVDFSVPLLLDDLNDIAFVLGLEDRQFDLDGTLPVHWRGFSLGGRYGALEGLLRSSARRRNLASLDCGAFGRSKDAGGLRSSRDLHRRRHILSRLLK